MAASGKEPSDLPLDWIDCVLILVSTWVGLLVMWKLNLPHRGKIILGVMLLGPIGRRAFGAGPAPRTVHAPVRAFFALVALASALVFGGGAALLATLRLADNKSIEPGILLAAGVAGGFLVIGALLDHSLRR